MTGFWQTVIFATILIAILVASAAALAAVSAWQRRRRQRTVELTIANEGNERSRYDIRAEANSGALNFRYSSGGADLTPVYQSTGGSAPTGPSSAVAAAAAAVDRPAAPPQASGPPLPGLVAELLVTVGYILPGSAGASLRNAASQIRYGQSTVDKAQKVGGRMAGLAGSAASTSQQIAGSAAPAPLTAAQPSPATLSEAWWRTPYVEPGRSLTISLLIGPGAAAPAPAEAYRVLSRSAERSDAAIVAEDGLVRLDGQGGLVRWLPYAAILALALLVALGAYGAVQAIFPVR